MQALGTERRVLFSERDRYLDTMPLADLVTALEVTISGLRPTEIMIPLASSRQDQEADFRGGVAACRPSNLTVTVQLVAAYKHSPTSCGAGSAADAGRDGLYVEIAEAKLHAKLGAPRCYRTPDPRRPALLVDRGGQARPRCAGRRATSTTPSCSTSCARSSTDGGALQARLPDSTARHTVLR